MLDYLRAAWQGNPVRVVSFGTSVLVALAAAAGLVVDEAQVSAVLAALLPLILGGGEAARAKVQPYPGEVGPPSDELLDLSQAPTP